MRYSIIRSLCEIPIIRRIFCRGWYRIIPGFRGVKSGFGYSQDSSGVSQEYIKNSKYNAYRNYLKRKVANEIIKEILDNEGNALQSIDRILSRYYGNERIQQELERMIENIDERFKESIANRKFYRNLEKPNDKEKYEMFPQPLSEESLKFCYRTNDIERLRKAEEKMLEDIVDEYGRDYHIKQVLKQLIKNDQELQNKILEEFSEQYNEKYNNSNDNKKHAKLDKILNDIIGDYEKFSQEIREEIKIVINSMLKRSFGIGIEDAYNNLILDKIVRIDTELRDLPKIKIIRLVNKSIPLRKNIVPKYMIKSIAKYGDYRLSAAIGKVDSTLYIDPGSEIYFFNPPFIVITTDVSGSMGELGKIILKKVVKKFVPLLVNSAYYNYKKFKRFGIFDKQIYNALKNLYSAVYLVSFSGRYEYLKIKIPLILSKKEYERYLQIDIEDLLRIAGGGTIFPPISFYDEVFADIKEYVDNIKNVNKKLNIRLTPLIVDIVQSDFLIENLDDVILYISKFNRNCDEITEGKKVHIYIKYGFWPETGIKDVIPKYMLEMISESLDMDMAHIIYAILNNIRSVTKNNIVEYVLYDVYSSDIVVEVSSKELIDTVSSIGTPTEMYALREYIKNVITYKPGIREENLYTHIINNIIGLSSTYNKSVRW